MSALDKSLRIGRRALAASLLATTIALAGTSFAAPAAPDKFAKVDALEQAFVDSGQISGAVMLVADKSHVMHLSAVGASDLATGRKMLPNDIFWIASMTKPMTAIAVGILADQGKLSFTDPVEKYLPEFKDQWVMQTVEGLRPPADAPRTLVKASRPITIHDLLTHTSGLGEYQVTNPHWTSSEFAKVLSREPLRFQPGTRFMYSTAGLDMASHIVEVVSGQSFDKFMAANLFAPLGMKDTTFWLSAAQYKRHARPYGPGAEPGKLAETTIPYMYDGKVTDHARPAMGGAGLFSTAEDVVKVYQMMLNGGTLNGKRILKPETVAVLTTKHTGDLKARPGMPWSYGFCIIEDPSQMEANTTYAPGSFGHGGAYGTNSWADPKTGIIHIFMISRARVGNPDNSPMRQAYEKVVAEGLAN
jgi:CubicO group peptidase (beta-lactamase class C family)